MTYIQVFRDVAPYRPVNRSTVLELLVLRVRTHQQSRVESSRVESSRVEPNPVHSDSQRRGRPSVAYSGSRCGAYTPAESSRVESRESCRVKSLDAACSIFVSQTLVIGRDGCYLEEEMDAEKLILLVKDHEAIYDVSRCEHGNRVLQ